LEKGMSDTVRLYYQQCYLKEFEARVIDSQPDGSRLRVYLDQTAFYPDSGGQPSDRGELGGLPILDVVDEGTRIAHVMEDLPSDDAVHGKVDWACRFDHMQQHTGQHILSAAFEQTGNGKTVSFHMGQEVSTIDLDSDRVSARQAQEAEDLANQILFENRAVRIKFRSADEANSLGLRKPTDRAGEVRLVEVEGFDLSACGGTHVNAAGEVGLILIRKLERTKGLTRIGFVCGKRALANARRDFKTLTEAGRLFSTGLDQVPELIARQAEELRGASKAQEKLLQRLAEYRARELWESAADKNGRRIIKQIFEAGDQVDAKMLAHAIQKLSQAVGLMGVKGKPALLLFAQSLDSGLNMGEILRATMQKVGGKGGGAKDFAQGGGIDENQLSMALEFAESLLP
jgi:alanyl-tRNA synthetase